MANIDDMTMMAFSILAQKAESKLAAALAEHKVSSPSELPSHVAKKIFSDCLLSTAVESFPEARVDALKHGLDAFRHPKFGASFSRLKSSLTARSDAFAVATGPDAAVVLAAIGLPVAPLDRKSMNALAETSKDIDLVAENFSKFKTAYVGYSPCDTSFYMLLTDCIQTMWPQILSHPRLKEVKELFERAHIEPPKGPFPAFNHGLILIPREPGDTVSTVVLANPHPQQGSITLHAGWTVNGEREGAPNAGFLPVPLQFIHAVIDDPQSATWIWRPVGVRVALN